jgi:hypothetical protein
MFGPDVDLVHRLGGAGCFTDGIGAHRRSSTRCANDGGSRITGSGRNAPRTRGVSHVLMALDRVSRSPRAQDDLFPRVTNARFEIKERIRAG